MTMLEPTAHDEFVKSGEIVEVDQAKALYSIAISLKRIADEVCGPVHDPLGTPMASKDQGLKGEIKRIADEVCGVPYDYAPGADNSRHRIGLVAGIQLAIEYAINASNKG